VAEFISENPQDSEISRDSVLSGTFPESGIFFGYPSETRQEALKVSER